MQLYGQLDSPGSRLSACSSYGYHVIYDGGAWLIRPYNPVPVVLARRWLQSPPIGVNSHFVVNAATEFSVAIASALKKICSSKLQTRGALDNLPLVASGGDMAENTATVTPQQ